MKRKAIVGLVSISFLIAMLAMTFNIQPLKASGTITINPDGSVNPSTANITNAYNVTYTFTDDINDSIVVERGNITIDGAGYKLQGTGSGTGIQIWVSGFQENVTIKNMEITSFTTGISLTNTGNITVSANKIRNCSRGIAFGESLDIVISGNVITNNSDGIGGSTVIDTVVSENTITNNTNGILFSWAQNNTIYLNNITNNEYGIHMEGWDAYNNVFYHNNFINNTNQVYIEETNSNTWDNGYPSGGNYWDDFPDLYPLVEDIYSGSSQNESGSDGIWDGPYEIDGNNTDNYPLTTIIPEFPAWTSTLPIFFVLTVATAIYKRRQARKPIR